jgi:hypothetical protein
MTKASPGTDCSIDKGLALLLSAWIEASLAIILMAARFWTQKTITKCIGWDDWCTLFGLV